MPFFINYEEKIKSDIIMTKPNLTQLFNYIDKIDLGN